jgi:hypothetical protein
MPRKSDKQPEVGEQTADYGDPAARRDAARRSSAPVLNEGLDTKPGVGVDQRRPPQRVDPGTRKVGRAVAVALAMRDPFERASIARSLVHAGCAVELIASSADVPPELEILVADFDSPEVFSIVDALRAAHAGLPVLAWTSRRADVERGLRTLKYGIYEVLDRTARMPDLIEAVRRLTGAK